MTFKTPLVGMFILSILGLAGCGSSTSNPTASTISKKNSSTANTVRQGKSNTTSNGSETNTYTTDQQVQEIYSALQDIPKTPKDYVNAYLEAISTRSGSLARGYLATPIRNQIPARVIGSSQWIGKWTINQTSSTNAEYHFDVTAYQYILPATQKEDGTWIEAFYDQLTVQSENSSSGEKHGPWIISSQQIKFSKNLGF